MTTVLEIANKVAGVVGVAPIPSLTDAGHGRTMRALMDRGGKAMARGKDAHGNSWAPLNTSAHILTTPGQGTYQLPAGFISFLKDTIYRQGDRWPLAGPIADAGQWNDIKIGPVSTYSYWYRQRHLNGHHAIELLPVPESEQRIDYEYITNHWLREAADSSTTLPDISDDTNVPLLYDLLVELDLTWRFKHSRGLDYGLELEEFEAERDRYMGTESGAVDITIGGTRRSSPISWSIPEADWGIRR